MMKSLFSFKKLALHLFLAAMSVTVQAADVISYGVLKGEKSFQLSPTPIPGLGTTYSFRAFVTAASNVSVSDASVQAPGAIDSESLFAGTDPKRLTFESDSFDSTAELNSTYPNGVYTLVMTGLSDGPKTATLSLTGDSYPNTPSVSNFSDLQLVNPAASLTVTWPAATADFIQLKLEDSLGSLVFSTPDFGQPGALAGSATSVTIPANTLPANPPTPQFFLTLTFLKIANQDTASYPGATGVSGYFAETQVFMTVVGGGGGPGPEPGDTNAPTLSSSIPGDNATRVSVNSQVIFTFSEAMSPTNAIEWSSNVLAGNFNCTWGFFGTMLTCVYGTSLPTNSVITWKLAGFKDAAGNPLLPVSGQFTTSCEEPGLVTSTLGITKFITYDQRSAAVPTIETNSGAFFSASVFATNVTAVTSATLQLPSGVISNLFSFLANTYSLFDSFETENGLASAYPPGAYTFKLGRQNGVTSSATLNFGANLEPNIPQIVNFAETQTVNPEANFVLRWLPLTNPSSNDSISLTITDDQDHEVVFQAPDRCIPINLLPTDTSITIPQGTFQAGRKYFASLGFFKFGERDTTSIPDIPGSTGFSKSTNFEIRTAGTGPQPVEPKFTSFASLPGGSFHLQLSGQAGVNYIIEASTDLVTWPLLTTGSSPSGVLDFTDLLAATATHRFYRAKSAP